ncbi:MAG: hypothetical protein COB51_10995 [Moraxellaceae bacterium]|nr:MAG: hypothetical protein COB51_10995 [Moraxellaceae bacterium]
MRTFSLKGVLLIVLMGCLPFLPQAFAAIDVYKFEDEGKSKRFSALMNELRCPKCQNQNLADSNAGLAKDLKDRAYELIQDGQSNDEVVTYLVERYGDFITYRPPLRLGTLMLWFGPLSLFVLVFLIFVMRGRASAATLVVEDELDQDRLKNILDEDN